MLYNSCFVDIVLILYNLNYDFNVALSAMSKLCASQASSYRAPQSTKRVTICT